MTERSFPTAAVLTCTTGILLGRNIGDLYDVCGYVLTDDVMTHQLPAASEACKPHLFTLHPWLADLDPPRGDKNALLLWLAGVEREHGAKLAVTPDPAPEWIDHNGIADLLAMKPDAEVIGVVVEDGDA